MKKGCIIVLAVLAVLVVGGVVVGAVAYGKASMEFGLSEALPKTSDSLVKPETRVRAVLKTDLLTEFVQKHLPVELTSQIPSWVPFDANTIVADVMPYEVSLLGGSDYRAGKFNLEIYINERRLGPALVEMFKQNNPVAGIPAIQWDPNLLTQAERGSLTLDGTIAIPDGLEDEILKTWTHEQKGEPLQISNSHLLELYIDNRNGDILTLAGAIAKSQGQDWKTLFASDGFKIATQIIQRINYITAEADLKSMDELGMVIRIYSENAQSLAFMINTRLEGLKGLAMMQGLTLDGTVVADDSIQAVVGTFTLSGLDQFVTNKIQEAMAGN